MAAGDRSKKIKGRVLRNLKSLGMSLTDVIDDEVYGEMQEAVNHIVSESNPDKEITITLKENVNSYPLTTEDVSDPSLTTYDNNIASVKVVELPNSFMYGFSIVPNNEFQKIIDYFVNSDLYGYCYSVGSLLFNNFVPHAQFLGTRDGSNAIFYFPEEILTGSEQIFFNGLRLTRDTNYTIDGKKITLLEIVPNPDDYLDGSYIKDSIGIVTGASLLGTKDGSNTVFYMPEAITNDSEQIFLNSVLQYPDVDYSIVNTKITFISIVPNSDDELICNYIKANGIGDALSSTKQPLIGTIIGGRLKIYPTPTSNFNNVAITLMIYLRSASIQISESVDPELDKEYDKALELFATAQFVFGNGREALMNDFDREVKRLRPVAHRKTHNLSRPGVL